MAWKLVSAVALFGSLCCGCSSWTSKQPGTYVTVQPDSGHDTEQTRKSYQAARKIMDQHARGEKCDLTEVRMEAHPRELTEHSR